VFPWVSKIADASPAVGLLRLRDQITSMNGISMEGKPYAVVHAMVRGDRGGCGGGPFFFLFPSFAPEGEVYWSEISVSEDKREVYWSENIRTSPALSGTFRNLVPPLALPPRRLSLPLPILLS